MPPRKRPNTEELAETSENLDTSTGTEVTGAGTWYEGFDTEEFPDAVSVGVGELLFFEIIDTNTIPMEQRNGDVLDTEVCQIVVLPGTTATEKEADANDEYVSTGQIVSVGEVRSLWINNKLLRDAWETWNASIGDEGVVKYAGKVTSKKKNEYQKWFVRFKKDKPRRVSGTR